MLSPKSAVNSTSCTRPSRRSSTNTVCDPGRYKPVTLCEKIGQLLMIGFRGMEAGDRTFIIQDIRAGRIGGVVLFDRDLILKTGERNIRSPRQLKELIRSLQAAAAIPLLVAVDQEGGQVARLKKKHGFPATITAQSLGDLDDPGETRRQAESIAAVLAEAGINLNFAPLVDLNVNPTNPIIGRYQRSFSADPDTVSRHALAVIEAQSEHGVISCLKHFPGHGSSRQDSHLGFTDVSATWEPLELAPYRKLIAHGLADAVMTAHIFNRRLDPEFPATLSKKTILDLLRQELGFGGLVVSDDMDMKAISVEYSREKALELALNAGIDIILMANNLSYDESIAFKTQAIILNLLESGRVSEARIDEACRRVLNLKKANLVISAT
ncbi:MAG: glycoside hydrolase family 3 protein [Acidobacteria bacterium]|nr:glycoside hydrolase family 3 protein [Acidobacteriota bacterium]MBU4306898.1 glycoside hydrolase family 3 protein [Acidobacteriota bacterium]MBU4405313.1 glycoside hydrolase family 3 protein [Acidobacteriota bacterium]